MRILVVDDDPFAGELIGAMLEAVGHTVATVDNAMAAMQLLNSSRIFDLIISDMNMPSLNGIEFFHKLRQQNVTLPFILLTGDEPQNLAEFAPELDACLAKNVTLEENLLQVVAGLESHQASNGTVFEKKN